MGTFRVKRNLNKTRLLRLVFAVAALSVVLAYPVASYLPAQRILITFANFTGEDFLVRVHLDDIHDSRVVEPYGATVFIYQLSGCTHKYFVIAHSTGEYINYYIDWHHVVIPPYGQLAIAFSNAGYAL